MLTMDIVGPYDGSAVERGAPTAVAATSYAALNLQLIDRRSNHSVIIEHSPVIFPSAIT
ncbi:MAG: hypothetical protein LC750_18745 [Actinobacteria bacterium]|nr:hypothetical protein [Actinomycetota bacterium]